MVKWAWRRAAAGLLWLALLTSLCAAAQGETLFDAGERALKNVSGLRGTQESLVCGAFTDEIGDGFVCTLSVDGERCRRMVVRLDARGDMSAMGYARYDGGQLEDAVLFYADGRCTRLQDGAETPVTLQGAVELIPTKMSVFGRMEMYQVFVGGETHLMLTIQGDGSFLLYALPDQIELSYASGDDYYAESGPDGVYLCYGDGTAVVID